MVHNGIEYGLMAAYAEGLNVLQHANAGATERDDDAETAPLREPEFYRYDLDVADVAEVWRRGSVVSSWLLDLTASALVQDPALDAFKGRVTDSGEGRWTLQAAIDEGVPASVLSAAVFDRFASQGSAEFANKLLSAMRKQFGGHAEKSTVSAATAIDRSSEWAALAEHHAETMRAAHLRDALRGGSRSAASGSRLEAGDLYLDYSKHLVTDETLRAAARAGRGGRPAASASTRCSRASKINVTEDRAVLHVALRAPRDAVARGRRPGRRRRGARGARPHGRLRRRACARGEWTGSTGKRIRNVVNIGIGGSDLGPAMAYEALRALQRPRPRRAASSRTSTAPTSSRRRATSTRPRRCSSSPPRRSRRSRR